MAINAVLAVIPTAKFDETLEWYAAFFGRPADERPMDSLAEWHLINGGIIQLFDDPGKAGRTAVNFFVDDLDERVGRLTAANIATTDPLVVAAGRQRLVTCADPEGNQLGLLEANN
jgi:predicted enzyme related to lactoylglutathione lyase